MSGRSDIPLQGTFKASMTSSRLSSRSSSAHTLVSLQSPPQPDTVDTEPELFDTAHLPDGVLAAIEADSFWCLSKLLDGIQDNYISHQPGIHRLVTRMGELVKRIDGKVIWSCGRTR